jgi:hypothetical protein
MDGGMSDAELLALAEREAGFLADENNHCAASIMRALVVMLRYKMRERHGPDANIRAMNAAAGLGE